MPQLTPFGCKELQDTLLASQSRKRIWAQRPGAAAPGAEWLRGQLLKEIRPQPRASEARPPAKQGGCGIEAAWLLAPRAQSGQNASEMYEVRWDELCRHRRFLAHHVPVPSNVASHKTVHRVYCFTSPCSPGVLIKAPTRDQSFAPRNLSTHRMTASVNTQVLGHKTPDF